MSKEWKNLLFWGVVGGFATLLVCRFLFGCIQQPKEVEAAAGYDAQQKKCIATHNTKAEIDACRDDVKRAWMPSDAGVGQ